MVCNLSLHLSRNEVLPSITWDKLYSNPCIDSKESVQFSPLDNSGLFGKPTRVYGCLILKG